MMFDPLWYRRRDTSSIIPSCVSIWSFAALVSSNTALSTYNDEMWMSDDERYSTI